MKLTYLGTGASEGIPALFCNCSVCSNARVKGGREIRHRSSALIDGNLLIDISPDIFSQAISQNLDLSRLKHVLITHTHYDHFYVRELLNIRPPFSKRPVRSKLDVLASPPAIETIKNDLGPEKFVLLADYVNFTGLNPFERFVVGDYTVTPVHARHGTSMPFIYIIEKDGRRILYANDSGFFPEVTWDFIAGIHFDFVTLDCTHVTDNGTPGHMCIEDNITVKKRMFQQGNINNKTRFAATHFAHNSQLTYFEVDERLRLHGIITAYDGLEMNI